MTYSCVLLLILSLLATESEGNYFDIYVNSDFLPNLHAFNNITATTSLKEGGGDTTTTSRLLSPLDKSPIEANSMFQASPSEGTDILTKPAKLITCDPQTHCIAPELQLERVFKVYYCKRVSHGVRFYYLIREGLTLHPKINLVESPEEADVIVYLPESSAWHKSECAKPKYFSKVCDCWSYNMYVLCALITQTPLLICLCYHYIIVASL
jgi:hypothetical protein